MGKDLKGEFRHSSFLQHVRKVKTLQYTKGGGILKLPTAKI